MTQFEHEDARENEGLTPGLHGGIGGFTTAGPCQHSIYNDDIEMHPIVNEEDDAMQEDDAAAARLKKQEEDARKKRAAEAAAAAKKKQEEDAAAARLKAAAARRKQEEDAARKRAAEAAAAAKKKQEDGALIKAKIKELADLKHELRWTSSVPEPEAQSEQVVVRWECESETETWTSYSDEISDGLENARNTRTEFSFTRGSWKYSVDQSQTTQTNSSSRVQRRIRRREESVPTPRGPHDVVPSEWTEHTRGQNCDLKEVERDSKEWQHVASLWTKSMPLGSLTHVRRIQNKALWQCSPGLI